MTLYFLDGPRREEECSITAEKFITLAHRNELSRLPCGHMFETNAIVSWLINHPTCPNCRAVIADRAIDRVWDINNLAEAIIVRDPPFNTLPAYIEGPHDDEAEEVVLAAPLALPQAPHDEDDDRSSFYEHSFIQLRFQDPFEERSNMVCSIDPHFFAYIGKAITDFEYFIEHLIDFEAIQNAIYALSKKVERSVQGLFTHSTH